MDTVIQFMQGVSWLAVLQIIWINILLSGDNAIVIALACRNIPPEMRKIGILWGTVGAVVLRVVLIMFLLTLLQLAYLKLVGGLLLAWIGIQLLVGDDDGEHDVSAADNLWAAVRTVILADLVMGLDNVLGIAAAATSPSIPIQYQTAYVIFGLVMSIPIVMWGSSLVLKVFDRFPIIVALGAGLIGWIAGDMVITDSAYANWLDDTGNGEMYRSISKVLGVVVVVAVGFFLKQRNKQKQSESVVLEKAKENAVTNPF